LPNVLKLSTTAKCLKTMLCLSAMFSLKEVGDLPCGHREGSPKTQRPHCHNTTKNGRSGSSAHASLSHFTPTSNVTAVAKERAYSKIALAAARIRASGYRFLCSQLSIAILFLLGKWLGFLRYYTYFSTWELGV